jgi:hypothetical protein
MKRILKIMGLFILAVVWKSTGKLRPDYTIGDFKKDVKEILG